MNNNSVLNLKTDALSLAVELAVVKNFLKVDFNDDDTLITKMIKTATTQCETFINKTLVEKTYIYSIYKLENTSIFLPFPPIKTITSITITNKDFTTYTLDNNLYNLDTIGGVVNFKEKLNNFYRIDIEYTAGLTSINDELVQALLMHIARMYEDRSGYSPIPTNSANIYRKYKQIRI